MHLENKTWAIQYIQINTAQWHIEWEVIPAWRGQVPWRGLKEWKMVSSGSVQLEGPSLRKPPNKTRSGLHRGNPFTHSAWPCSPDTRRSPGNVFMCPKTLTLSPFHQSDHPVHSVVTKQKKKNVFKCPGYSGRGVGPSSVKQELHVGASTGANRQNE